MTERLDVPSGRPAFPLSLLVAAVAFVALGAWFALDGRDPAAGVAVLVGLALLVGGGRSARAMGSPGVMALLAAIAWSRLDVAPRVATAALIALVTSYLASYLRAKSTGLGFDLEESMVDRSVLLGAPAVGLVGGLVEPGLWVAVAWSSIVAVKRAFEAATQGEPG